MKAPTSSQTSPKSHRGTQPRKPTICPPFAPCFQMFLYFCPIGVSQNTEKTQDHFKEILTFAPFQPILSRFAPFKWYGCPHPLKSCQSAPIVQRCKGQGAKSRSKERERERERGGTRSPQAHKKRAPPPIGRAQTTPPPHHKFAPKNQQKVTWGALKKFSEKFFVGMFRGKEKPLALSQRKGAR